MTPKDKAKELYNNYLSNVVTNYTNMNEVSAKQCALICVKEILEALNNIEGQNDSLYSEEQHYREVKKELEKL